MDEHATQQVQQAPAWLVGVVVAATIGLTGLFVWWLLAAEPGLMPEEVTQAGTAADVRPGGSPGRAPPVERRPPPVMGVEGTPLPQGQMPATTLVTLKLQDVTPQQAFAALAKQSGMEIWPNHDGVWTQVESKRVNLDVTDRPFWEVMLALCGQCDMYPTQGRSQGKRSIWVDVQPRLAQLPHQNVGAFALSATNISHHATVEFLGERPLRHQLSVQLRLLMEPKAPVFAVAHQAVVEEAADDAGHSMALVQTGVGMSTGDAANGGCVANVMVPLAYPPDAGSRIALIKGYAVVILSDGLEKLEFTPQEAGTRKVVDGIEVELEKFEQSGGGWRASFVAHDSSRDAAVRQRFGNYMEIARLVSKDGREINPNSGGSGGSWESYRFHVGFSGAIEPQKVLLTLPKGLQEVGVPFAFNDLPLPE